MITTYGLDPSLRHGCLVECTWDFEAGTRPRLVTSRNVFSWTKRSALSLSTTFDLTKVQGLVREVRRAVKGSSGVIGVDWTIESALWKGRRGLSVNLAFFVGYLTRELASTGMSVVFLSPYEVRQHFGMRPRAEKTDVVRELLLNASIPPKWGLPKLPTEDYKDAVVLSFIIARVLQREAQHAGTTQAHLPRG